MNLVNIDTISPTKPTISSIGGSDSVISSLESDNQIVGISSPFEKILISRISGNEKLILGSTTSNGKGEFVYILSEQNISQLGQKTNKFFATSVDIAGNETSSDTVEALTATYATSQPIINSVGNSDNTISSTVDDNKVIGVGSANKVVTFSIISQKPNNSEEAIINIGTTVSDQYGKFSYALTDKNILAMGETLSFKMQASQTDIYGNISKSELFSFNVDLMAPNQPIITSVGGEDQKITNKLYMASTDNIVKGVADRNTKILLHGSNDGITYNSIAEILVSNEGKFEYALNPAQIRTIFKAGSKNYIIATDKDLSGNIIQSVPYKFSLENIDAPTASINGILNNTISASYNSTAKNSGGINIAGTALNATEVKISINSHTYLSSVNSRSEWSVWIPSEKLPNSRTETSVDLTMIAYNLQNDSSQPIIAKLKCDSIAPNVTGIILEDSQIRIQLSETIATPVSSLIKDFSVRAGTTAVTIKNVSLLNNTATNSSEIVLDLSRTPNQSSVVKVSYTGNEISDQIGNKLATFKNETIRNLILSKSSITNPSYSFTNLQLKGAYKLNINGNDFNNILIGNESDNILQGGRGADILTGGLGRDTFNFVNYTDSLLLDPISKKVSFDIITDLQIGNDAIDGPKALSSDKIVKYQTSLLFETDNISTLIGDILPIHGAALVTFGFGISPETPRTFLVIDNGIKGYSPTSDILVEIKGYTGELNDLKII